MSLKIDNTINPWISNYGRDKKELNLLSRFRDAII